MAMHACDRMDLFLTKMTFCFCVRRDVAGSLIYKSWQIQKEFSEPPLAMKIPRCKITVLKRTFHQDLVDTYLEEGCKPQGPCECFQEGQEFIVDPSKAPGEFCNRCPWAWADIYKAILSVASGANMIGAKQPGIVLAGCNDWFRPVIFKIERLG